MIKGKLYKLSTVVIFCTKTDINPEHKCYEGFIIKSEDYSTLGYHSTGWNKESSEEYVGQLSLNNVLIKG